MIHCGAVGAPGEPVRNLKPIEHALAFSRGFDAVEGRSRRARGRVMHAANPEAAIGADLAVIQPVHDQIRLRMDKKLQLVRSRLEEVNSRSHGNNQAPIIGEADAPDMSRHRERGDFPGLRIATDDGRRENVDEPHHAPSIVPNGAFTDFETEIYQGLKARVGKRHLDPTVDQSFISAQILIYQNSIPCPALLTPIARLFSNDISKRGISPLEYATVLTITRLSTRAVCPPRRKGSLARESFCLPRDRPLPISSAAYSGRSLVLSGQDPGTPEDKKHGKVGRGVIEEEAYGHARLARLNLLSQMRSILGSRDRVSRIVKVLGMVNVADDFLNHPAVINGCSEVFGENGRHARSAIGVASLAGGIRVEGPPELDRSFAFDVLRFWNLRQGRKNG
jgi:enamine deaminase RidA (YjgF/YER057c/UK114 family)